MTRMVFRALSCIGLIGLFGSSALAIRNGDGERGGDWSSPNWSNGGSYPNLARQYPRGAANLGGTAGMPPVITEGRVARIDTRSETLTLATGKELQVKAGTRVMKEDGTTASLMDVREGDQVRASFAPGSTKDVQQLTITSPPSSPGTSRSTYPRPPTGSSDSSSSEY